MNKLQVFKYEAAEVRTILKDGEPWWVLKDVCAILEIGNASDVSKRLDEDEKGVDSIDTLGGRQEMTVVNESGLYNVILRSDKPEAKAFKRWVTHDILPEIRTTGGYSAKSKSDPKDKRMDILDRNARSRTASLYMRIAENDAFPRDYRGVFLAYASKELSGENILPLPKTERETYSAGDLGEMFGVSGQRIGRIANAHGLKTDEYGQLYHDKSPYSAKEVDSWRYFDTAIPVFKKILGA